MIPTDPPKITIDPATHQHLLKRAEELRAEIARLEGGKEVKVLSQTGLVLPCGCRIEPYDTHGLMVTYCDRHSSFLYSSRPGTNTDVIYFVDEKNMP